MAKTWWGTAFEVGTILALSPVALARRSIHVAKGGEFNDPKLDTFENGILEKMTNFGDKNAPLLSKVATVTVAGLLIKDSHDAVKKHIAHDNKLLPPKA